MSEPTSADIRRMLIYRCVSDCDLTKDAPTIQAYIDGLEAKIQRSHDRSWALATDREKALALLRQVIDALPAPIKMSGRNGVEIPLHEIDVFLSEVKPITDFAEPTDG